MSDVVSTVITGIVGVTGVFFTWLTAKQARDTSATLADKAAEDNRRHDLETKRHEAYVKVLQIAFELQVWLNSTYFAVGERTSKSLQEVKPIEASKWSELNAWAAAFSSIPVGAAFKSWKEEIDVYKDTLNEIRGKYMRVESYGKTIVSGDPLGLYEKLEESAHQSDKKYMLMANKINVELTGSD